MLLLGAVACVTLLDRLEGDFVSTDFDLLKSWQHRAQMIVLRFIKKRLANLIVPWCEARWSREIMITDIIDKMGSSYIGEPLIMIYVWLFYLNYDLDSSFSMIYECFILCISIASDMIFHFENTWWGIVHCLWVFITLGPYASRYNDFFPHKCGNSGVFLIVCLLTVLLLIKYYNCLFCYSLYIFLLSLM